jgi:glyoxylase-like metal-dependent hydrolase (beta-lactamase superfamily II)
MTEVKILIEGYTTADSKEQGKEETCPTITLVRDKNIVMVVDPGVLENQEVLVNKLKKEDLTVNDVNIVCITHSHIDHYRNIGMFPRAKTLEYYGLWDGGSVEDWKEQFTDDIRIIKTPGHNYDGISLLVKTGKGFIAIVGDIFWKENSPVDDPYASDKKKLKESRKKILELADYIIPGHGKMFKVKK